MNTDSIRQGQPAGQLILGLYHLHTDDIDSFTVMLISRITLNLRMMVYGPAHVDERTFDGIPLATLGPPNRRRPTRIHDIDSDASEVSS